MEWKWRMEWMYCRCNGNRTVFLPFVYWSLVFDDWKCYLCCVLLREVPTSCAFTSYSIAPLSALSHNCRTGFGRGTRTHQHSTGRHTGWAIQYAPCALPMPMCSSHVVCECASIFSSAVCGAFFIAVSCCCYRCCHYCCLFAVICVQQCCILACVSLGVFMHVVSVSSSFLWSGAAHNINWLIFQVTVLWMFVYILCAWYVVCAIGAEYSCSVWCNLVALKSMELGAWFTLSIC